MGFIKKDGQKKEEAETTENQEYQFPEEAELKECRHCRMMIPKTARTCPNCKKRQKTNWVGLILLILLLAACGAGVYYYLSYYVPAHATASAEAVETEAALPETVRDVELAEGVEPAANVEMTETLSDGEIPVMAGDEEPPGTTEGAETLAVLPDEMTASNEETVQDAELAEGVEPAANAEMAETLQAAEMSETPEPEPDVEMAENTTVMPDEVVRADSPSELEEAESPEPEAGHVSEFEKDFLVQGMSELEKDSQVQNGPASPNSNEPAGITVIEMTEVSNYTEEEFRALCRRVDYKKLLRSQETYLNAAVMEELTVMEQVDGGLFDENIYYLCKREDGQGITRYYIVRDDREEDDTPILAGDVIQVYGQLFGSCKLPGYLVKTQPVVPAVTMVYFDLVEE